MAERSKIKNRCGRCGASLRRVRQCNHGRVTRTVGGPVSGQSTAPVRFAGHNLEPCPYLMRAAASLRGGGVSRASNYHIIRSTHMSELRKKKWFKNIVNVDRSPALMGPKSTCKNCVYKYHCNWRGNMARRNGILFFIFLSDFHLFSYDNIAERRAGDVITLK